MRKGIPSGVIVAAALTLIRPGEASAQAFASDGRIVVGVERITGVFIEQLHVTETTTIPAAPPDPAMSSVDEVETSSTTFALLGSSAGFALTGNAAYSGGPSVTPRLGLDVFVAHGISVGGSIMFTAASGSIETTEDGMPNPDEDQPSGNLFLFAPRAGFGYAFNPTFAIWPRLGITYARYGLSDEDEVGMGMGPPVMVEQTESLWLLDLNIEVNLVITPVPTVAILVGPFIDIGLTGSYDSEETPELDPTPPVVETDVTYTSFGLAAGLAVVF